MPTENGDLHHWRGVTDAEMSHLAEAIYEIKRDMKDVKSRVDSLCLWRAWVLGAAAAISACISLVVRWVK